MRRRCIISRALAREMLPALVLATSVSTFLLLIRSIFMLADLFITHQFSTATALKVLLLTLPHILALTIPIGILFATLVTASRWASDSELVALQASGVGVTHAAKPLVLVAGLLFVVDLVLTWQLLPAANRALQQLYIKVAFSGARASVEPHVFNEDFPGQLLFVDRIDRDSGSWHGILLFDLTSGAEERLVVADSGDLVVDPRDGSAWLNLLDTTTHLVRPDVPGTYQQNFNRELKILLQSPNVDLSKRTPGVRETDSAVLLERLRDATARPEDRENAQLELHKRLAIPAASLAFALVAFPLGARNRRGGRGFALTASVGLIVVYYVFLNNGEYLARYAGWPPAAGVWLPNALLSLVALALLARVSHGVRSGSAAAKLWHRLPLPWSRSAERKTARNGDGAAGARRRSNRRESRNGAARPRTAFPSLFPGILDRHMVGQCLAFFFLVVIAICAVYLSVNLSELLDEIQKNAVPLVTVATYYAFSLPQILHEILPLAFVIAFLGTAAILERHNETTALKAAGISLTRVAAPLFVVGVLLGGGLFLLDESVVQRANRGKQHLEDIIKGRKVARSYRATDRLWLFLPDGHTLVNFLQFEPDTSTLVRPSVYVFDDRMNLRERYMANRATFTGGRWRAEGAWSRKFIADASPDYVAHGGLVDFPITVDPSYFGREYRKPSQMSLSELRDYIATLQGAGYRVDRLQVQLYQKLAYPLSLIVLSWLALPFAFRARRRGTVVGVALALIFGMAYFALMAFTTKLGEAGLIEPALGAWTPPVIFGLLALNRHTTLRT